MAAKRIQGITIEIGGETTKLEKALSGVNKSISGTQKSLRDINSLLKLNPGNVELLTQKQEALKSAIDATKEKLEKEKTALEQLAANSTTDDVTEEQKALEREIIATQTELNQLTSDYKEFGSVAGQQIQAAGQSIKETGESARKTGQTLTDSVTRPLVDLGKQAVESYAEVDKTMQLTNKTMGNSTEEAQKLDTAMKTAAANSTFGMQDAATASLNFARAGLNAEEAAAALAPAMNLAAGEGGNLDTVSAGLVATINGFHGSFDDAGKYADVFAAACNNSALDVDSLSNAMSVATPVFSAAGYQVNDAALYMGIMANNGIDADKAANSLKTGLAKLVKPAKEGAEKMDELGISVTKSDGTMKDSVTIQKELHDAFGKLSESEQIAAASAIFGKNQMAPWLALINTAPEDVGELDKSLKDCGGTTEEMANAMMSGFGGSLEKVKSSLDVLVTSLGQALAPTIEKVVGFVQGLVDKFNSLTPAQQETIAKIGLVVAALGPLLVIVGTVISAIGSIVTGIGGVIGVISGGGGIIAAVSGSGGLIATIGGIATAAAPFLAGGAIIAGVVAGTVLLIKNWDKVKDVAKKVVDGAKKAWEGLKTGLSTIMKGVSDTVKKAWDGLKTTVTNIATNLSTAVKSKFEALKTGVTTVVTNLASGAKEKFDSIKTTLTDIASNIGTAVKGKFETLKSGVTTAVTNLATGANEKFNSLKETLTTVASNIGTAVKGKFDSLKSGVVTTAQNLGSSVKTGFTSLKEGLGTIVGGIVSTVKSKFSGMKTDVSKSSSETASTMKKNFNSANTNSATIFTKIASTIATKLTSISTAASKMATSVGSSLSTSVTGALNSAIDKLSTLKYDLQNFKWSFPKPDLPHFTLNTRTTTVGGKTFTYPSSVSVSWYKRAYDNAMMFTSPTVLQTARGLKGFGDGNGGEIVLSDRKLREIAGSGTTNYTVNVYGADGQNVNALADAVQRRLVALQRQKEAAGLA